MANPLKISDLWAYIYLTRICLTLVCYLPKYLALLDFFYAKKTCTKQEILYPLLMPNANYPVVDTVFSNSYFNPTGIEVPEGKKLLVLSNGILDAGLRVTYVVHHEFVAVSGNLIDSKIQSLNVTVNLADFFKSFLMEDLQIAGNSGYGTIYSDSPEKFDHHGRIKGGRCFDFTSTWLKDYEFHLPYSMGPSGCLFRIAKIERRDSANDPWVECSLSGYNGRSVLVPKG